MPMIDTNLIQSVRNGDMHAFGELVSRYQGLIYGLAYHQVRNYTDAQDIAQNVFVHVFKYIYQLEQPERLVPWLRTITANECKMWLRSKQQHIPIDDIDTDPSIVSLIDTKHREHERHAEIRRIIDSLPERSRLVVTLHYLSGLTCREIGEYMGIPANTVTQHLYRARRQLKDLLSNVEEDYAMNKLPESFTSEVLQNVSLSFLREGSVKQTFQNEDLCGWTMGIGETNSPTSTLTLWMKQNDACAIQPVSQVNVNETVNMKLHMFELMLKMLDSIGVVIDRAVLRASESGICKASITLRQGKIKTIIDMRPSDALGLAATAKARVYADQSLIRFLEKQENLGEVGVDVPENQADEHTDIDVWKNEQNIRRLRSRLQSAIWELGLSPEDMIDTVRYHVDEDAGVIKIFLEACPGREMTFDLDEYRPAIKRVFDAAHNEHEGDWIMERPGKVYKVHWSMCGNDARQSLVPEDMKRFETEFPNWNDPSKH